MRSISSIVVLSMFACCCLSAQQAPSAAVTPQPLAREVMYRILFRQVAAFQTQANQLAAQSKPNAFVANYHQNALQLSPLQAAIQLMSVAVPCVQQITGIDQQAEAIIGAVKQKFKGLPKGPNSMVPPPPPELAALELNTQRRSWRQQTLSPANTGRLNSPILKTRSGSLSGHTRRQPRPLALRRAANSELGQRGKYETSIRNGESLCSDILPDFDRASRAVTQHHHRKQLGFFDRRNASMPIPPSTIRPAIITTCAPGLGQVARRTTAPWIIMRRARTAAVLPTRL